MPEERGDVGESLPPTFLNMRLGTSVAMLRLAGAQVEVEAAVVVEIGEVASHGRIHAVQAGCRGHVLEALAVPVAVQPVRRAIRRPAHHALDHVLESRRSEHAKMSSQPSLS